MSFFSRLFGGQVQTQPLSQDPLQEKEKPTESQFLEACSEGNLELMKNLFDKIGQKTKERGLGNAVYKNYPQIIRLLLEEGVNPNINDSAGWPILLRMASEGNKEMIELYLEKGGKLDILLHNNSNALHWSAFCGHLETTKYLVSVGIDYKAKSTKGETPLDFAKEENENEIVKFLQEVQNNPSKYWKTLPMISILKEDFKRKESELTEQISRLNGEKETISNEKQELQIQLTKSESKINSISNEKEQLSKTKQDLETQRNEITNFFLKTTTQLKDRIEQEMTQKLNNQSNDIEQFEIKLRNSETNLEIITKAKNELEKDLNSRTNERDELQIKLDSNSNQISQLQQQKIDVEMNLNETSRQKIDMETNLNETSRHKIELDEKLNEISRLKEELEQKLNLTSTERNQLFEKLKLIEEENEKKRKAESENPKLADFLNSLNLSQFLIPFQSKHIEFYMLEHMNDEKFEKFGLSEGQIMKISIAIQEEKKKQDGQQGKKKNSKSNKNNDSTKIPIDFVGHFGVSKKEIVEGNQLGSGAFGDVVQAVWNSLNVAVKKLKKMSESNGKSFKEEANLMLQLRHPHIVSLMGFVDEEPYMLIMEFVENGNLADYLKLTNPNNNNNNNNTLSWKMRKQFTFQIGQGMLYLHSRDVLHRDLKSLNILLTKHLEIKVSDFGLASLKRELSDPTKSSSIAVGTIAWMAPELMEQEKNTKESDVYAFGMVCFEIASHQFPWSGKTLFQIVQALSHGQREEIPKSTPPEYARLIESCWKQKPKVRLTFHQIVDEIEKLNFV